jgi:hypothetical protein
MLGQGIVSRALRALEGWLSRSASALFTSSPAFVDYYFKKMSRVHLPIRLIENKMLAEKAEDLLPRPPGPPWIIGWFGMLRCRKSLHILADLVRQSGGAIRVEMRGRPALDQIPDFHAIVAATEGMDFLGPYRNPDDLPEMYGAVHFVWAIDMYEEGQNSAWLLPNRLYEGGFFAAVPLALETVETGHFLQERGLGGVLPTPLPEALASFFKALSLPRYRELERDMAVAPREFWSCSAADCKALVDYMRTLPVQSAHD